ncbi:Sec-independent protein translocase subunit TatA/TatB [Fundidesulfovibrio agrisoli]|uniref:Sec-independent protein translocase subunit TatA/TatB n=1 Tax=Fundidesulfovibrio agrisoli TaxID=2922717 RepID=UPI001FADE1E7|nr:twin-arginine translocase TatA/TatE family subunit [Fundidesulfovibrio agrisoli]
MFSSEMILILIVALVLIGPSKLPEIMKMAAKGLSEIRRLSLEVKSTLQQEVDRIDAAKRIEEAKKEYFGDIENMVNETPAQPEQAQAQLAQPEAQQETVAPEVTAAEPEPVPAEQAAQAEAPKAPETQEQAGGKEPKEKPHA